MESSIEEEYAAFLQKVKRTIYVDNLSPQVTESVMKAAFNQFGNVVSVQFIPNYLQPNNMEQSALVEMENSKQAREIIDEMAKYPFMVSGMPRPVRARAARIEMFDDRPRKPGRVIQCYWLSDSKMPELKVAQKIKDLVKEHDAEASFVLKYQLLQEQKLHDQQAETLKANYKKFELIDRVYEDGSAKHLARHYNINISDA